MQQISEQLGRVALGVLVFRIVNALFVRTYFNPDEFWQSLEVAHRLVFGYGYLTWEWLPGAQIRGYAHPYVFAVFYKILQVTNTDTRWLIAYGPRILQGIFAAVADMTVYLWTRKMFDEATATWALFCQLVCWFNFYCLVRPFSNSLETVFTVLAFLYWPWQHIRGSNRLLSLCFAALATIIRPTSGILWLYLGISYLVHGCQDRTRLILLHVLPVSVVSITFMMVVDFYGYGEWVNVPLNFLKFNVLEGKSHLYGEHPWHWYFSNGLPSIIGTILLPLGFGLSTRNRQPLYALAFVTTIYSFSAHKEFRFVLPLLPIAMMYAGCGFRNLQLRNYNVKWGAWFILVTNIAAAVYLSRWHQAGPLDTMDFLSRQIESHGKENVSVHFLTNCHATPYYSHLHVNISMWFPDCAPSNRIQASGSESDQLQRSPLSFVEKKYQSSQYPTYLVMFSDLEMEIQTFLQQAMYQKIGRLFHAHVGGDADDRKTYGEMAVYVRFKN